MSASSSSEPPRPSSSGGRALVAVNSMEHASLVIRSLRSFSHSQKSYHRTACSDDKILGTLRHFDQLVIQQGAQVEYAKRVDDLITSKPATQTTSKQKAKVTTSRVEHDVDSSDDENDFIDCKEPSAQSTIEPRDKILENTVISKGNDDSDDEWFKSGLFNNSDDEEDKDMAALMQGFVGPKSTKPSNSTGKGKRTHQPSAIHDLEDSLDTSPHYLLQQDSMHREERRHDGNRIQTRSAGSSIPGEKKIAHKTTSAEGTRSKNTNSSKRNGKNAHQSSTRESGESKNFSLSKSVTPSPSGAVDSTHSGGVDFKKHRNVQITPGQRIRVRPSRKNKNSN